MNVKEMRQEMDFLQERCEYLDEMMRQCKEQHGGVKLSEQLMAKYSSAVMNNDRGKFNEEQSHGVQSVFSKLQKRQDIESAQKISSSSKIVDNKNNKKGTKVKFKNDYFTKQIRLWER